MCFEIGRTDIYDHRESAPAEQDDSPLDIDYILFSDGDFDNDGIGDLAEGGENDAEADGLSAWEDPDSDNDGFPDGRDDVAGPGQLNPKNYTFQIAIPTVTVQVAGKAGGPIDCSGRNA